MRPRKRDSSFLRSAVLAGLGGVGAIGLSIGLPIWSHAHGHPYAPAFSLFAVWGFFALAGSFACLRTYFLTDRPPPRPPRGGVYLQAIDGGRSTEEKVIRVVDRAA